MIQKEVSELRRRFRPDKNAISRVYGCYVNTNREIISYLNEPVGLMTQEESEQYLGLLKKAISGALGKIWWILCSPPSRWRTAKSTGS